MKIKVVITDDHPIVTQGFKHFLSTEPDIEVSATFSDGKSLLKWLSDNTTDILLLDIYLQDSNGLELCKKISEEYPDIGIIAISGQDEGIVISQMLQNGALGYVLKNAESEEITEAIRSVFRGEKYLCKRTQESLQKLDKQLTEIPKITRREKEVLLHIAEGLTTQETADKLFISPHTVESHRKNLMEKFEVKSMTSVISKVKSLGLI
ncbi:response regulator [Moheibacter sp.]|uniref:response regulator n=1 Tax=Moheibacter sp. TaxID=1965316 RepID=UPI003C71C9B0